MLSATIRAWRVEPPQRAKCIVVNVATMRAHGADGKANACEHAQQPSDRFAQIKQARRFDDHPSSESAPASNVSVCMVIAV